MEETKRNWSTHDFYYDLPKELIAQTPLEPRDSSRLLVLHKETGEMEHRHFYDVIDYLNPGDCLVLNDSRVLPARLYGIKDGTGAKVEFLLLSPSGRGYLGGTHRARKARKAGHAFYIRPTPPTRGRTGRRGGGNPRIVEFHYEGISMRFWIKLDRCRCRITSQKTSRIRNATRMFIQRKWVRPPRQRQGFTLRPSFWSASGKRGSKPLL